MESKRIDETHFKKLIGKWKTEGVILKTDESPEMKISGMDKYEIILDGFFILHKADVMMGDERSQTHELIGLDKTGDQAILQHYDNQGASGTMTGSLKEGELIIDGDGLRFKGQFSDNDRAIIGIWEKLTDKKWNPYLKMSFMKLDEV